MPAAAPLPAWGGTSFQAPAAGGLPPSPPPWSWQPGVIAYGDKAAVSLGLSKPGAPMGMLEMMVRGAFLDPRVYRQAALDQNGNGAAATALGLTFLSAILGGYLISFSLPGFSSIGFIAASVVLQVLSLTAAIGVMAALSQSIIGRKLEFWHLFRSLAYAQSPGVLSIVPVLGQLLNLWRLPTSVAAVREVSGAETGKSVILLIVGAVASTVVALVLSPLLFTLLR